MANGCVLIIEDPNFVLRLGRHIIIAQPSLVAFYDTGHILSLLLIKYFQHLSAACHTLSRLLFSQNMRNPRDSKVSLRVNVAQNRMNFWCMNK